MYYIAFLGKKQCFYESLLYKIEVFSYKKRQNI